MKRSIPVVFLPGLLCDAGVWRGQIDALSDMISPIVADLTRDDSIEDMATRVLDEAPPRFVLVALSMGGYVALEMLRQQPDRIHGLCLMSTSARADSPEQAERRRLLMAMSREGQFRGVTPRLLPWLIDKDRLDDRELTSAITSMAERVGREAFLRQQTAMIGRQDSRKFLGEITCNVLVLCGRNDAITPPWISEEIADGIPGAEFRIIESSGHLITMERSQETSDALREWIASLPPV